MRKLSRSLLLVGALALTGGLAACGDDVTVASPPPPVVPTPQVRGVTVSPATANVRIGGSVQLNAGVTADSGATATVAWKTSDATIATVDASGKVTGVKAGTVGITATATANGSSASGSATITVTNASNVQSITLNPTAVVLNPGQTQGINATVTLDPTSTSSDKGVTWSSSDNAIATVSAAGVVTAVAPGNATITAAANADTASKATASITVRTPVPTQISIQSITVAGNLNSPVNINNVAGQIDVKLNVDPGDNVVSRVEVLIDGAVVCTQAFSAAQSTELQVAAATAQAAPVPIVCSINTAQFDPNTGIVSFFNGARQLSARAITSTGQQVATPSTTLVFNNANSYVATVTYTGTVAAATSATGLLFNRGGMDVAVLPVIYTSGLTLVAGGSLAFGGACDASGIGQRTVALTAPAAGSSAWIASFSQSGTPGTGNVAQYEYCAGGPGEAFFLTSAGSNGNQVFAGLFVAGNPRIRLDNRPPGAPTFVANPNNRQNGWLNAAVSLAGLNTGATSNGWLANGTADQGVGGYTRMVRVGAGPTVDAALAATASAAPATPAPTIANTTDCAVISATDLLGNESALPAAGGACTPAPVPSNTAVAQQSLLFGVDIAPPTIAFSAGLASGARLNGANIGGEFQVTVNDTGTVGNSGMLTGQAVVGTIKIFNAAGTACFFGATAACNPASVNAAPAFPLVPTAGAASVTAQTTAGYYTYVAMSQDAAGNQSGSVTRTIVYDATAPALTTALFNTPLNGPTATFTANASDNLDLWKVNYTLTYAGGLAGPLSFPAVILNTFPGTTPPAALVNSNVPAGITINGFMRQVQNVTGNSPLTVGGAGFKPTAITGTAIDQANNTSGAVATPIPGASVTAGVDYTTVTATLLIDSWSITAPSAATNISNGAGPAAPVNPTSVTLTATAAGPTATFQPPFSRVDFYELVGGNLVLIGSATTPVTNDNGAGFGRTHDWSISWTPGAAHAVGVATIYAIGVSSNGDGLVTQSNANITITNP